MDKLREKINSLYKEYKEFDTVVKEKNKEITNKKTTIKEMVENKSIEEVQEVLIHLYVDTLLYNKDLQILFFKLVCNIESYLEFSTDSLDKEVLDFYQSMKTWIPKRLFMLEKEEIVETEIGVLEKARKEFLQSDFFKEFLEKVKK
jgi:hypothetical protein